MAKNDWGLGMIKSNPQGCDKSEDLNIGYHAEVKYVRRAIQLILQSHASCGVQCHPRVLPQRMEVNLRKALLRQPHVIG